MLVEVGGEWAVPARVCLAGTGLSLSDIDRVDLSIDAEQELRVVRNLAAVPVC